MLGVWAGCGNAVEVSPGGGGSGESSGGAQTGSTTGSGTSGGTVGTTEASATSDGGTSRGTTAADPSGGGTTTTSGSSSESTSDSEGGSTTNVQVGSTSTTGSPPLEVCNGVDDDLDGLVDEFSSANAACLGCTYLQRPGEPDSFYAFCTSSTAVPAAQTFCEDIGGDLVSIHSDEENAFVYQNAGMAGRVWIGFTDEAVEGQWIWSDGSVVDYTRWNPGQPNNADGAEHCACMLANPDRWHDTECENAYPFVCKAPA